MRKSPTKATRNKIAESLRRHFEGVAIPIADRFWPKVKQGSKSECWPWHKPFKTYYPLFSLRRIPTPAHRVAFELAHGKIEKGVYVCHTCDNPACCNPNHLYAGTQKTNVQDAIARGRFRFLPHKNGEAVHTAKLTAASVLEMRQAHAHGATFTGLSQKFNVSRPTATRAIKGMTWAHVQPL